MKEREKTVCIFFFIVLVEPFSPCVVCRTCRSIHPPQLCMINATHAMLFLPVVIFVLWFNDFRIRFNLVYITKQEEEWRMKNEVKKRTSQRTYHQTKDGSHGDLARGAYFSRSMTDGSSSHLCRLCSGCSFGKITTTLVTECVCVCGW